MTEYVRVLIVDDHDDVRRELVAALRRAAGINVVGATGNADEALGFAQDREPDVILLDVKREDGAGLKLCSDLSHNSQRRAVVVFTSYLSPEDWSRAREAGAVDYLLKQIDFKALVAKIVQVAARSPGGRQ